MDRAQASDFTDAPDRSGQMTQLRLRLYTNPGSVEIFIKLVQKSDEDLRLTAVVDTGAETTLLPNYLKELLEYKTTERGSFVIEQAGIAEQAFEATEAIVTLALEDEFGAQTATFEAPVWFGGTDYVLLGFNGILDRAVLHLDMPNLNGTLDLDL